MRAAVVSLGALGGAAAGFYLQDEMIKKKKVPLNPSFTQFLPSPLSSHTAIVLE